MDGTYPENKHSVCQEQSVNAPTTAIAMGHFYMTRNPLTYFANQALATDSLLFS